MFDILYLCGSGAGSSEFLPDAPGRRGTEAEELPRCLQSRICCSHQPLQLREGFTGGSYFLLAWLGV